MDDELLILYLVTSMQLGLGLLLHLSGQRVAGAMHLAFAAAVGVAALKIRSQRSEAARQSDLSRL